MKLIVNEILSHKAWRRLVKKQQRKRRRSTLASLTQSNKCLDPVYQEQLELSEQLEREAECIQADILEKQREAWKQKDAKDHQNFLARKLEKQKLLENKQLQQVVAWHASSKKENETRSEKITKKLVHHSEKDRLVTETQNPEPPGSHSLENSRRPELCPFFKKTGACRFGPLCSREHIYPITSRTILLAHMYTSFSIHEGLIDELDSDLTLEYSETETHQHFRDFYFDVLKEFRKFGTVTQLKVCCNKSLHLRGNVYVQYETKDSAAKAISVFNGRWYAGKQLSCQVCPIEQWKSAICGLFWSRRCPKGDQCNFLHVYRNPGNAFYDADRISRKRSSKNHHDQTPATSESRYNSRESRDHSKESRNHSKESREDYREPRDYSRERRDHSKESCENSKKYHAYSRESRSYSRESREHSRDSHEHSKEFRDHSRESREHSKDSHKHSKQFRDHSRDLRDSKKRLARRKDRFSDVDDEDSSPNYGKIKHKSKYHKSKRKVDSPVRSAPKKRRKSSE